MKENKAIKISKIIKKYGAKKGEVIIGSFPEGRRDLERVKAYYAYKGKNEVIVGGIKTNIDITISSGEAENIELLHNLAKKGV